MGDERWHITLWQLLNLSGGRETQRRSWIILSSLLGGSLNFRAMCKPVLMLPTTCGPLVSDWRRRTMIDGDFTPPDEGMILAGVTRIGLTNVMASTSRTIAKSG